MPYHFNCIDLQAILQHKAIYAIDSLQLQAFLAKDCPDISAELVIANILADPLMQLCSQLTDLTQKDGYILLSGILKEQRQMIIDSYHAFAFTEIRIEDEWTCLLGKKRQLHA